MYMYDGAEGVCTQVQDEIAANCYSVAAFPLKQGPGLLP